MNRNWIRVLAVMVGLVVITSACSSDSSSTDTFDPNRVVEVTYQVVGDMTSTEITYTYNAGQDIFRGVEDLPFEVKLDMNPGDIFDLGAQTDGSTLTCRILMNGVKYAERTETGGNFPVCQGFVPDEG